jgi:hypothetical protein
MEDSKYVNMAEAAEIINPGFTSRPYDLCWHHIKSGHITPVYPTIAICCPDTGAVVQQLEKPKKLKNAYFLREEVEAYIQQKKHNQKRGAQKKVTVTQGTKEIVFESVMAAAIYAGIVYYKVYWALTHGNEIEGYSFKYVI